MSNSTLPLLISTLSLINSSRSKPTEKTMSEDDVKEIIHNENLESHLADDLLTLEAKLLNFKKSFNSAVDVIAGYDSKITNNELTLYAIKTALESEDKAQLDTALSNIKDMFDNNDFVSKSALDLVDNKISTLNDSIPVLVETNMDSLLNEFRTGDLVTFMRDWSTFSNTNSQHKLDNYYSDVDSLKVAINKQILTNKQVIDQIDGTKGYVDELNSKLEAINSSTQTQIVEVSKLLDNNKLSIDNLKSSTKNCVKSVNVISSDLELLSDKYNAYVANNDKSIQSVVANYNSLIDIVSNNKDSSDTTLIQLANDLTKVKNNLSKVDAAIVEVNLNTESCKSLTTQITTMSSQISNLQKANIVITGNMNKCMNDIVLIKAEQDSLKNKISELELSKAGDYPSTLPTFSNTDIGDLMCNNIDSPVIKDHYIKSALTNVFKSVSVGGNSYGVSCNIYADSNINLCNGIVRSNPVDIRGTRYISLDHKTFIGKKIVIHADAPVINSICASRSFGSVWVDRIDTPFSMYHKSISFICSSNSRPPYREFTRDGKWLMPTVKIYKLATNVCVIEFMSASGDSLSDTSSKVITPFGDGSPFQHPATVLKMSIPSGYKVYSANIQAHYGAIMI